MNPVLKSLLVSAVVFGMLIVLPGDSCAITNGQPDEGGHPYVGAVLFFDEDFNFITFCSGALISPTVVLVCIVVFFM